MTESNLHNPQLDGDPFWFEGGPIGVLLVHGFTATPVEVRRLADRLNAQGYTVAGPLMAGHGTALPAPTTFSRCRMTFRSPDIATMW